MNRVHTRTIEIATYDSDDEKRLIVEGSLRDDRCQESRIITGETFPPGTVHHMAIRLTINSSNLVIEDVETDLISVPRPACRETAACLEPVKGMSITKGFTARIKKLVGGEKGCAHVVELLLAMAPAAIQGLAASQSNPARKPAQMDRGRAELTLLFLTNTCRVWRADGPMVRKFKETLGIK